MYRVGMRVTCEGRTVYSSIKKICIEKRERERDSCITNPAVKFFTRYSFSYIVRLPKPKLPLKRTTLIDYNELS